MTITTLALSSPALLAEYVHQSDLTGFFEKRLIAPPDHAALLIRNGALVDAYKGANFSLGGLFQGLRAKLTGSMHVRVLLADLRPFRLQCPLVAVTRDHVEVAGVATFELQLDPDRPANILGLVAPTGQLSRADVLERFRPHLVPRVFDATVGRLTADEVRGNVGLQDKLQADAMREIERIAGDIGLLVRSVSIEWARNVVEAEAMKEAQAQRQEALLDAELQRLNRRVERSAESTTVELRTRADLDKVKIESDDDVARLALAREVEFIDARVGAQRRQELEALQHEIDTLVRERVARFENQQAEAGQRTELVRHGAALARIELEVDALRQKHLAEMKRLGAFTDLELRERAQTLELQLAERANRQSRDHIAGLAQIEREGDRHAADLTERKQDGESRRKLEQAKQETQFRLEMMRAGAGMTPEQILALNAGFSPEVAQVMAEQARANAKGREETMAVMREMVQQATDAKVASEEQAREMFRAGMDGAARVAHGAGGKGDPGPGAQPATATVECPACGRENSAKAKFCVGCGAKLRV